MSQETNHAIPNTTQQKKYTKALSMQVTSLDAHYTSTITERINNKTKPIGALGELENIALQLALIQSNRLNQLAKEISLNKPTVVVFAGDHGISEEGISIAPSDVTRQMVLNFINGGAAINCFCRSNKLTLNVVDTGIVHAIDEQHANLYVQRLGAGTDNFSQQAAMSEAQVIQGLAYGSSLIKNIANQGCQLFIFGEMGIGNTSSAAAILAALTNAPVDKCVGSGTGINATQLLRKKQLITKALARIQSKEPLALLQELGGFELVQMTGAIIAAAELRLPILVDGFIVSTAALLAVRLQSNVRDYLLFSHQSDEAGHKYLLEELKAKPLLQLGLRLGEGTGAALAFPLLTAASAFYNDMASFEEAGVTV